MKRTPKKKKLVTRKEVVELQNIELSKVREVTRNYEVVSSFLRALADETATNPTIHSEIVKSATLLRVFLEQQTAAVRNQYPQAFEEEKTDAVVEGATK